MLLLLWPDFAGFPQADHALQARKSSRVHYIVAGRYLFWTSITLGVTDKVVHWHSLLEVVTKITEAVNLLGIATSLILFRWKTRGRRPQFNLALPITVVAINIGSELWSVVLGTTLTRSTAYLFLVVGAIGLVKMGARPSTVFELSPRSTAQPRLWRSREWERNDTAIFR
jgi:hypothetical protein